MIARGALLLLASAVIVTASSAVSDAPWSAFPLSSIPLSVHPSHADASSSSAPRPPVRLAFIADVDLRPTGAGRSLLQLVSRERADATIISGDLDYLQLGQDASAERRAQRRDYPRRLVDTLDSMLGAEHPVYAVFGNHDVESGVAFAPQTTFPDEQSYAQALRQRMQRQQGQSSDSLPAGDATRGSIADQCDGHVGGDYACAFRGQILILGSNIAVSDEFGRSRERRAQHESSLARSLSLYAGQSRWRICHWHVTSSQFNTGALPQAEETDPGMKMYEQCLSRGGIVATGHDHAYARSKAVSMRPGSERSVAVTGNRRLWKPSTGDVIVRGPPYFFPRTLSRPELIVLSEADSNSGMESSGFVFVNGLGGRDIRGTTGRADATWWSKLVNAGNARGNWRGPSAGDAAALLCDFGQAPPTHVAKDIDEFVRLYDLPPSFAERLTDLAAQSAQCELKNALGDVLDSFSLLNLIDVEAGIRTSPLAQNDDRLQHVPQDELAQVSLHKESEDRTSQPAAQPSDALSEMSSDIIIWQLSFMLLVLTALLCYACWRSRLRRKHAHRWHSEKQLLPNSGSRRQD